MFVMGLEIVKLTAKSFIITWMLNLGFYLFDFFKKQFLWSEVLIVVVTISIDVFVFEPTTVCTVNTSLSRLSWSWCTMFLKTVVEPVIQPEKTEITAYN